ncbi:MAG: DUF1295 domain-containing protein [Candidatus Izimaplasma sp.]|nr:DUF1295 domain-containing protein [Candidatus Izimaplasma bacterium]
MEYIKLSKKQTGILFILIYLLAVTIGVITFLILEKYTNINIILNTFIADLAMTVVVFGFSLLTKNSSVYDPYWSVIPPVIIVGWILYKSITITTPILLLLIGVGLWAIRLTYNWWKNWTGFKEQDWRYDLIKERTRGYYMLSNFGAIHLIPTLVVFIQLINAYEVIQYKGTINVVFVIGFILMLFASTIQFIADKQMFEFRQERDRLETCIDRGIWRYSRHPNYLGELSIWVGLYLMYLGVGNSLDFNIIYPIAMILLFLFVSIPLMEKKLEDRPCYSEYKEKVSMLLPYRKKK